MLSYLNRLQRLLLFSSFLGLVTISYLLITREQDWSRLSTPKKSEPSQQTQADVTSKLMPHRNHNQAAAAYAYDCKIIQQYLNGELLYTGENLVFLTIDDGANPEVTPAILDILKQEQVPATFFPIGSEVTLDKAALYKRHIQEGHAIGLHSFSHDLSLLYPNRVPDSQQILFEAKSADKAFKRLFGMKFHTRVWRYPGGALSWKGLGDTHLALEQHGWHWIDWNASIGDAEPFHRRPTNPDNMMAFHEQSMAHFPKSPANLKVVLLHDAKDKQLTIDTLPRLITYYKERGYTFGVLY